MSKQSKADVRCTSSCTKLRDLVLEDKIVHTCIQRILGVLCLFIILF
jgi:hypothetical protein